MLNNLKGKKKFKFLTDYSQNIQPNYVLINRIQTKLKTKQKKESKKYKEFELKNEEKFCLRKEAIERIKQLLERDKKENETFKERKNSEIRLFRRTRNVSQEFNSFRANQMVFNYEKKSNDAFKESRSRNENLGSVRLPKLITESVKNITDGILNKMERDLTIKPLKLDLVKVTNYGPNIVNKNLSSSRLRLNRKVK